MHMTIVSNEVTNDAEPLALYQKGVNQVNWLHF